MKHLTYDGAAWLLGDTAAQALLDYAVALAKTASADSIELQAIDEQGNTRGVAFLLGPATMMTADDSASEAPEPDNAAAVNEIEKLIAAIESPPSAQPATVENYSVDDEL